LFGVYENFPEMHHSIARFSHKTPTKELQKVLIQCLCQLNQQEEGLDIPESSRHNVHVKLDFGIADGLTFNYLNKEVLQHCRAISSQQTFPVLDFLCIVRYYAGEKGKRSPLRFDYHMLRFLFSESEVELQVFHEKGTRRLSMENLVTFLTENMNQALARRKSSPLRMGYTRTL